MDAIGVELKAHVFQWIAYFMKMKVIVNQNHFVNGMALDHVLEKSKTADIFKIMRTVIHNFAIIVISVK